MALELATAYVSLTVSARGLLDKVKAELGGPLETAARAAGDKAGGQLGRGLTGAAKAAGKAAGADLAAGVDAGVRAAGAGLGDPLVKAARVAGDQAGDQLAVGLAASARDTGADAGRALVRGVDSGLDGFTRVGDGLAGPLVAAAKKAGDRAGDGLSDELQRSAREAGRKAGDALEDGLAPRVRKAAVGLAAVFAGVQVGGFLKGAVDAAADTGEQLSKLNVLLGQSSKELDEWSETTAEAFKISRREALTAAGTFATLFRGVGQTQPQAAAMSKALVELAGDMASFGNANPQEVIEALGSALRGESEPITKFGVLLNDATLKQRAFTLGLVQSTKEGLTPAVRVQAAYAEILAQTVVQQGDAARTSGSLANQQKELAARFQDVKAALGQGLLPIAQQIVSAISGGLLPAFEKAVPVIVEMANQVGGLGADFVGLLAPVAGVAGALGAFGVGALATGFAFSQIAEGVQAAKAAFIAFQAATATLSGGLTLLGAALGGIAAVAFIAYAKNSAEAKARQEDLTTALTEAGDPAQGLVTRLDELSASLSDVKKTTAGAAEGVKSVDAFFAQATAAADDTEGAFNSVGISAQDMAEVTREGGGAFADAAQQALNLASGNSDLTLATERASDAQAGMIRSLFDANAAGKITDDQLADMLNTLDKVSGAWDDTRGAQIASIQADVDKHTALGDLAFSWEAEQRAASGAKDEYGQMLFVGAELEKELKRIDDAGRIAAAGIGTAGSTAGGAASSLADVGTAASGSVGGLGDAAGASDDFSAAQGTAGEAAEEHKKALKDLSDGIDDYITRTGDGQEATDNWVRSLQELARQLAGQQLGLEIQNTGDDVNLKGIDAQIKAETEAQVEALQDAKEAAQRGSAAEVEALQDAKKAEGRVHDAELDRLRAQKASAEEIAAAQDAKTAANDAYDDAIEAVRDRSGFDASFDDEIAAVQESAAARMAEARANLGIASEANQEAFEGMVSNAQERVQDLIDSGGDTLAVADLTNTLQAELRAKADELGIILKDNQTGIEGNSKAALENRALLEGMVAQAKTDVQELIAGPGTTIEDVTALAGGLSDQIRLAGESMGLSGPALDDYVNRVKGIGDAAIFSNDQLKALPSQHDINIAYTMTLNAEQFKEELRIASQAFKDEMSRENVALGIIEIAGGALALQARATGGPVKAGQPYLIGEDGIEVFIPDVSGTVVANHELAFAGAAAESRLGAQGGVQVGTINVTEAQSAAHVVDEVNARLGWMLTTRNER